MSLTGGGELAVVTIPEDALEEVLDASNGYEITVVVSFGPSTFCNRGAIVTLLYRYLG